MSKHGTIHENEESVVQLRPPDSVSESSGSNYALVANPSALGYQSSSVSKRSAASASEQGEAQQPSLDPLAAPHSTRGRENGASSKHTHCALADSLRDQWRLRDGSRRAETPRAIRHAARSALSGGTTFASLSQRVRAHGAAAHVRWARTDIIATEEAQQASAVIIVQRCGAALVASICGTCGHLPLSGLPSGMDQVAAGTSLLPQPVSRTKSWLCAPLCNLREPSAHHESGRSQDRQQKQWVCRRPGHEGEPVSVRVRSRDGTAIGGPQVAEGIDYVHVDAVLHFGAGESAKAVTVQARRFPVTGVVVPVPSCWAPLSHNNICHNRVVPSLPGVISCRPTT